MSFRDDALGMFWQNLGREKSVPSKVPRALPPTPDTGWRPPKQFPDLSRAKRIVIDVETKDLELRERGPGVRRGAKIVGLAVGADSDGKWYFPIRHEVGTEWNMDPGAVLKWAHDALSGPQPKIGANILYDVDFLAEEGVTVGGPWYDVQIAEPLLDENRFSYSLESLGLDYLGEGKVRGELEKWVERAYRTKNYRQELWRTSPLLVGPYAEWDADAPLRILDRQLPRLHAEGLDELWQIESDLLPMLLAMRRHGVRVNEPARARLDNELSGEIGTQQLRLDAVAGFKVNVNAGRDLARAFDRAGVPYPRTGKGAPSFTKGWMEHSTEPLCVAVMEVRKLLKYRDTFVRGYMELAINGRIHTLFHSMKGDENGAVSGRFASSDPNLQNIPKRDKRWGPLIRALFIPEDGHEWVRHDWSQIEYRFLVHFGVGPTAKDAQRLYLDRPDTDFHKFVQQLTGLERDPAKTVNFGLVYGMGVTTLAARLGMTVDEATRNVFDVYHGNVPFVRDTYERASSRANSRGYVKTFLNRRARFDMFSPRSADGEDNAPSALPEKQARARWGNSIRRAFTHKALNRVLQGSAADLMKKAMRDIWKSGVYNVLPPALLTVHDELAHSRPPTAAANEAIATIKHIMETCLTLRVPIIAEEERGPNWGECTK